ncbi:MAG: glycoside hydrolase family 5 protein [Reyranellaceae bacterium]
MRLVLSLLAFLAMAVSAQAEPIARVEGKRILGADGQVLDVKGINLGNWLMPEGYMFKFKVARAPHEIATAFERLLGREGAADFWRRFRQSYVTRDDIRFIKSVGFNTVRVPLHFRLFMTEQGALAGDGWELLDRLVGWAREAGLYVILDLHAAPGGQTGFNHDDSPGYPLLFYVPQYRERTVRLWQAIASRYHGDPTILGYDLLNEPIASFHDVRSLNPRLEPFYREVTEAIRAVDPGRIVFLAGGQWSSTLSMFGRPFAPNLVYTYHCFWSSTERDAIQHHLNFSNRYDVPLFLGETGEFTDDWHEAFRKLHELHGIGWAFWAYKNLDTPSTVVSIPRPEGWHEIVAFADGQRPDRPPAALVERAIAQYLDGLQLARGDVRWRYLAALGLARGAAEPGE